MPVLTEPAPTRTRGAGGDDHDGTEGTGDRREPRRGWPLWLALITVALLATLLTYLGMLTQIWANMSGAQLPGA